jgi:acyl-coenzyme A thioesterase PaaI-like protein
MSRVLKPSPRQLKFLLGLFPPYVGSGIRMRYIADDGSRVVTTHRPRRINANLVGTAFGGTIQTMTDGFYLYMGLVRLGGAYNVWDAESHVTYLKPGRGKLTADMRTDDETFDLIRERTADGSKYLHWFTTDITDVSGDVVATVRSRVYFRLKERAQPDGA